MICLFKEEDDDYSEPEEVEESEERTEYSATAYLSSDEDEDTQSNFSDHASKSDPILIAPLSNN